ncbi:Maf1-domain-containing protein [Aureobasidium pullulans]|nr:Maf1-domain-containing protein [Aureobasidium pullulans]
MYQCYGFPGLSHVGGPGVIIGQLANNRLMASRHQRRGEAAATDLARPRSRDNCDTRPLDYPLIANLPTLLAPTPSTVASHCAFHKHLSHQARHSSSKHPDDFQCHLTFKHPYRFASHSPSNGASTSRMKYVPLRDFQVITDALNFSTTDLHVIGSCDLYTTKAAGSDKKLYKNIESSLEKEHGNLLRLAASLSPPSIPIDSRKKERKPSIHMPEINLSRDSPFGSFNQISARRTFAYLIATLNASHPDYDFSHILRPTDFRKTTGTAIRRSVDSTLMNMRPRRMSTLLSPHAKSSLSAGSPQGITSPNAEFVWGEQMWKLIDKEMDLRSCEKYTWDPEDDPFEAESALWSQHYFFFNKDKKRVCYLNFRSFSVLSHSPANGMHMRTVPITNPGVGEGAGKRAQYWLGHSVDDNDVDDWREDDDIEFEDSMSIDNDSNEGEYRNDLDDVRDKLEEGYYAWADGTVDSNDASGWDPRRIHRGSSEGPADAMEI